MFAALGPPGHATAALGYYRALFLPWTRHRTYSAEQRHLLGVPPVPLLYLHGANGSCQLPELAARAGDVLRAPSEVEICPASGTSSTSSGPTSSTHGSQSFSLVRESAVDRG